jgi:hypothetical protein
VLCMAMAVVEDARNQRGNKRPQGQVCALQIYLGQKKQKQIT